MNQQNFAPGMRVVIRDAEWRIRRADGSLHQGATDSQGRSPLLDSATKSELLSVNILPEA